MSAGTAIILGAVAAAIAALVLLPTVLKSSRALRRRFGPEFTRAVRRHEGDVRAARRELSERLYRYGDLPLRELDPAARQRYEVEWSEIHARWPSAPATAVVQAEGLMFRLARERGIPHGDVEQTSNALSVRHAEQLDGFRELCAAADRVRAGEGRTSELRGALAGAQGLFEQLVTERPHRRTRPRRVVPRRRPPGRRPAPRPPRTRHSALRP
ncbi:hypothetical protein ACTWP5_21170 [Streptomyces sp. 4N509B]|uniref:hypothetical protein n=1 Tax=Streptomyces sp. 4N509B TaxID=3457413 RepID=UPI003FCF603A